MTTLDEGGSYVNSTGSSASPGPTVTSHAHAGSAFEGGCKIAFDPRDLERENEDERLGRKVPRLTLLEEVLLLGIKDKQVIMVLLQISMLIHFCIASQGHLSFWNDNISYALRGCILIELALRQRISLVKDPIRKRSPPPDCLIEVIDDRQTGETILDEALKMMKAQETEKMGINNWIDLLSGQSIWRIYFNSKSNVWSYPLLQVKRGTL